MYALDLHNQRNISIAIVIEQIFTLLTRILNRRYNQFETVRIRSPTVCNILQRNEICLRYDSANWLLSVAARQVRLEKYKHRNCYCWLWKYSKVIYLSFNHHPKVHICNSRRVLCMAMYALLSHFVSTVSSVTNTSVQAIVCYFSIRRKRIQYKQEP